MQAFLSEVDEAYEKMDMDYELMERAMDLASDELMAKNESLQQEILDRKKAEEALKEAHRYLENRVRERTRDLTRAMEEADRANLAKTEFLSRMSHELRTPMNAILGFTQLLEQNLKGNLDELQISNLHQIHKAGDHLLDLINEVLELSKIDSGNIDLENENIVLAPLLKEVLSMIRPMAMEKNLIVSNGQKELEDNVFVYADRIRLKQILLNLLSNATKYNVSGGSVILKSHLVPPNSVSIHIEDSGLGISKSDMEQLFQPFFRGENSYQCAEGTGVGLSITKHLTELMGGRIEVKSEVRKGTCFTLNFPGGVIST